MEADSLSSAHPFYVLDDFIDVRLIDLDLLPEHKQSGRVSFRRNFKEEIKKKRKSFSHQRVKQGKDLTPLPDVSLWSSLG